MPGPIERGGHDHKRDVLDARASSSTLPDVGGVRWRLRPRLPGYAVVHRAVTEAVDHKGSDDKDDGGESNALVHEFAVDGDNAYDWVLHGVVS